MVLRGMRSRGRRRQGFTLVELVITLAIVLVLAVLAKPALQWCIRTAKEADGTKVTTIASIAATDVAAADTTPLGTPWTPDALPGKKKRDMTSMLVSGVNVGFMGDTYCSFRLIVLCDGVVSLSACDSDGDGVITLKGSAKQFAAYGGASSCSGGGSMEPWLSSLDVSLKGTLTGLDDALDATSSSSTGMVLAALCKVALDSTSDDSTSLSGCS